MLYGVMWSNTYRIIQSYTEVSMYREYCRDIAGAMWTKKSTKGKDIFLPLPFSVLFCSFLYSSISFGDHSVLFGETGIASYFPEGH